MGNKQYSNGYHLKKKDFNVQISWTIAEWVTFTYSIAISTWVAREFLYRLPSFAIGMGKT